MELKQVAKQLEEVSQSAIDMVVNTNDLKFQPSLEEGLILDVRDFGEYVPTEWAHTQIAEKHGVPKKFYDQLREAGRYDLVAEIGNEFKGNRKKRLLRTLNHDDNTCRAFLSSKYRPIDNYSLFMKVADKIMNVDSVEILDARLTESSFFMKVVDRNLVEELPGDDYLYGGIQIGNSEVGARSMTCSTLLWREVCKNGAIGADSLSVKHLGRDLGEGMVRWSDETLRKDNETIFSQVDDILNQSFDPEIFRQYAEAARNGTQVSFDEPTQVINNLAAAWKIPEYKEKEILAYLEGNTQYDLMNAFTRSARDFEDYERQVEYEKMGGQILTMDASKLGGKPVEAAEP